SSQSSQDSHSSSSSQARAVAPNNTPSLFDSESPLTEEERQCVECKFDSYLSYVACPCKARQVSCPAHCESLWSHRTRVLYTRCTMQQLTHLLASLREHVKNVQQNIPPSVAHQFSQPPTPSFDIASHRLTQPLSIITLPPLVNDTQSGSAAAS